MKLRDGRGAIGRFVGREPWVDVTNMYYINIWNSQTFLKKTLFKERDSGPLSSMYIESTR